VAQDGEPVDPTFDISGWASSYTGRPVPAPDMREWVDRTVDLLLGLRPRSVLDVGCGTGLILFGAAGRCERYWGTDVTTSALDRLRRRVAAAGDLDGVELFPCPADRLEDLPEQRFDAVLLNSVVQYFPDEQYLLRVIEGALGRLDEGGTLVLGDIRSLPLLETFHASVQFAQAAGDLPAEQLRERARTHAADDEELVIDPEFFRALPARFAAIIEVRVLPKRGHADTEMTRFRYDVLLRTGERGEPAAAPERLDWTGDRLTLTALRETLTGTRPATLTVHSVPNARLREDTALVGLLDGATGSAADLRDALASSTVDAADAVDPEDLYGLAEQTGYHVELDWSGHGPDGAFDARLWRADAARPAPEPAPPPTERPWSAYVNGAERRRVRTLVPKLRAALGEKVPDYMVPQAFVFLDALPLTPNGKIDRKALPAPDSGQRDLTSAYVAPRTAVEAVVAGVWAEVLEVDRVGVLDDFFDLGGHSLLSTRIVARIRDAFQVDIPLHRVFSEPTVAGLSRTLVEAAAPGVVEKTAQLLIQLSGLSDDQVREALQATGDTQGAAG
jgi:SAM-dependent methyltransferase/acyl carrier protein